MKSYSKLIWIEAYRLFRKARNTHGFCVPEWVYGPDPDSPDTHPLQYAWMIANRQIHPYPLSDRLRDYKLVKQRYKEETGNDGPPPFFW